MPSPIEFKLPLATGETQLIKGYCTVRKSAFGVYKAEDGNWKIIHKASGFDLSAAKPANINSYGKVLAFVEALEAAQQSEVQVLNEAGWLFKHTQATSDATWRIKWFMEQYQG